MVLIAFHEELPATRTKYLNALRGGRQTGMSVDEFRETLSRGLGTQAGIKQLAATVKKRSLLPAPGRESQQLAPPVGDAVRVHHFRIVNWCKRLRP